MIPKVSIIILNWNGKEDTIECLESLKHITYPNYEILLVDNGSTDGSVECFKERYPEIEIIENGKNLGFAEGNNIAIKWAINSNSDYVLLLNNDTLVDPYFLTELINVAESDPKIGVVGPTVYYYHEANKIQSAGGKIVWNRGTTHHLNKNKIDDGTFSENSEVDYIQGCALLAKSKVFKDVGYLNRDYFAYWEETDWCARVHKAGYKIYHVPKGKIWHKEGMTSRKLTGFRQYHATRNRFWFMRTNAEKKQYISFIIYFFGYHMWFSSAVYLLYSKNLRIFFSFLKGIKDGVCKSSNLESY